MTVGLLSVLLIGFTSVPQNGPVEVANSVEGQTAILKIVTEGERVKRGQVIIELDAAYLKNRLIDQKIAEAQATGDLENAKRGLEVAEVNALESEESTLDEINSTKNEARVAELDIRICEERLVDAKAKMKSTNDRTDYDKAITDLDRSKQNLARAQAKLKNLETFVKQRRKAESDLAVNKAKTNLKNAEAVFKVETSRRQKIEAMIEACTLKAPIAGRVRYNNPDPPRQDGYVIEEGALVRERQVIVRIIPD